MQCPHDLLEELKAISVLQEVCRVSAGLSSMQSPSRPLSVSALHNNEKKRVTAAVDVVDQKVNFTTSFTAAELEC